MNGVRFSQNMGEIGDNAMQDVFMSVSKTTL